MQRWTSLGLLGVFSVLGGGCAADAAPLTASAQVVEADPGAPVDVGAACTLEVAPDYRQGVNCRVSLVCGEASLFGGRRAGGYAVCTTSEHRFLTATDSETTSRDGDPALALDLTRGTLEWRDGFPVRAVRLTVDTPSEGGAAE